MRLTKILSASILALFLTACQSTPTEPEPLHQIVVLEHVKAKDMADTLNQFASQDREQGEPQVVVRANEENNAVLITGSKERVNQVLVMIARLDKKQG